MKVNKKLIVYIFGVSAALLFISLSVYYVFIQLPIKQSNRALSDTKIEVSRFRLALVEHRGVLTQYIGLNPKLAIFSVEQPDLLNNLNTSLETVEKISDKSIEMKGSSLLIKSDIKELLAAKEEQLNSLLGRSREVVKTQKNMLSLIENINSTLARFYEYNPVMNLGDFDLGEDIEFSKEAFAVTKKGMKEAADNFEKLDIKTTESQEFLYEYDLVLAALGRISSALEAGDVALAERLKREFINEYFMLKKEAFDIELTIFKSEKAVENLRELTSIIGELEEIERELEAEIVN